MNCRIPIRVTPTISTSTRSCSSTTRTTRTRRSTFFFFLMTRRPPIPTLFPYTTLFRSKSSRAPPLQEPCGLLGEVRDDDVGAGPPDPRQRLHHGRLFVEPAELARRAEHGVFAGHRVRSEEHTSELQSQSNLVCRLLLEK